MARCHAALPFILVWLCASAAEGEPEQTLTNVSQVVAKAARVFAGATKARELNLAAAEESAQLVTMVDSMTPFLADSINGRQMWRVEFKGVPVGQPADSAETVGGHARDFVVYVDPDRPGFVKVVSQVAGYNEAAWHKPSARQAEAQLRNQIELHTGFPAAEPGISFLDALARHPGYAERAQEIDGEYVLFSHLGKPAYPIWSVHFYGVHTTLTTKYRSQAPFYITDHWRAIVDASTGKEVFSSNSPYPPIDTLQEK